MRVVLQTPPGTGNAGNGDGLPGSGVAFGVTLYYGPLEVCPFERRERGLADGVEYGPASVRSSRFGEGRPSRGCGEASYMS
jgi:hypothetical protein